MALDAIKGGKVELNGYKPKPSPDMALVGYREKGAGRPTKRDRRKIDKFRH